MTTLKIEAGQLQPGRCPNCHLHVSFQTNHTQLIWPRTKGQPDVWAELQAEEKATGKVERPVWVKQGIFGCLHCRETVTLHQLLAWENGSFTQVSLRQVWPVQEPRSLTDAAPAAVRDLFLEAGRCEAAGAYRAAGAMYRAAVEELCKDKGTVGKNLYEKIADLKNRGVAQEIVDDLDEARLLGNWSLHDGLEFSAEEVADVAELITEAVHVLYVQPEERRRMRETRKARRDAFKAGQP